ncbi:hypothetical protein KIPB_003820 [Kipferlia bialata]|uniref:Uncharacterized protein n=1 Tax=Kipferlia bialata TaxID=797122 RepID=A0A391NKA3_9EUKA|nr:hypothetical protein KIPB_003820 [Kipferlia bialata]|eukprot:g3820.t1
MSDVPSLFVESRKASRGFARGSCVPIGCNALAVVDQDTSILHVYTLLENGIQTEECAHVPGIRLSSVVSLGGVIYGFTYNGVDVLPLHTMVRTRIPTPSFIGDCRCSSHFVLDNLCYLVVEEVCQGIGALDRVPRRCTLCLDPERPSEGYVDLGIPTPAMWNTLTPQQPRGDTYYGVNREGCVVSFKRGDGWSNTHCVVSYGNFSPLDRHTISVYPLGSLLLISQRFLGGHPWSLYDTISGEVARLPNKLFSCGEVFYPTLAVLQLPGGGHPVFHYIDPSLEYPHRGLRWGIIPPGAVVTEQGV